MPIEVRKKVLIVDDDQLSRMILRRNVVLAGYDVILAADGQEAMQKIQGADLAVVDLIMPEMDGFETCRQIKNNKETSTLPVIVVTGLQADTDIDKANMAGADAWLIKPVKPEEFIAVIKKHLGSPFKIVS